MYVYVAEDEDGAGLVFPRAAFKRLRTLLAQETPRGSIKHLVDEGEVKIRKLRLDRDDRMCVYVAEFVVYDECTGLVFPRAAFTSLKKLLAEQTPRGSIKHLVDEGDVEIHKLKLA